MGARPRRDSSRVRDGDTDSSATTGDTFTFKVNVDDNIGVRGVRVEYRYGDAGAHVNTSMTEVSTGKWSLNITVPSDSLDTLHYFFSATDSKPNRAKKDGRDILVVDNDVPYLVADMTKGSVTTGDTITISIEADNNIRVDSAFVVYWLEGDESNSQEGPMVEWPPGTWSFTITVPNDRTDLLKYRLSISDTAKNVLTTSIRNITVIDDEAPWIGEFSDPGTVLKGSELQLEIEASDNIGVDEVHLEYWVGFDEHEVLSMAGEPYSFTVEVPRRPSEDVHFFFTVLDAADNHNDHHEKAQCPGPPSSMPYHLGQSTPRAFTGEDALVVAGEVVENDVDDDRVWMGGEGSRRCSRTGPYPSNEAACVCGRGAAKVPVNIKSLSFVRTITVPNDKWQYNPKQDVYIIFTINESRDLMKTVVVALLISFIIISIAPHGSIASSGSQSLTVILTNSDKDYSIGDEVIIQAHVFRHSARVDPDNIEFNIGVDLRTHPIQKVALGLFEAEVTILETDLDDNNDLSFEVQVSIDGPVHESDFDYSWFWIEGGPYLEVDIYTNNPSDISPIPGQEIEYMVTVTYGGEFVDPDHGTLDFVIYEMEGAYYQTFQPKQISVGIYLVSWKMPSLIDRERGFSIGAIASYTIDSRTLHDQGNDWIGYSPFEVWVHYLNYSKSSADIDIYIHDVNENPIEGAVMILNSSYYDTNNYHRRFLHELHSDEYGRAHLSIAYPDICPHCDGVYIRGEIRSENLIQNLSTFVPNIAYWDPLANLEDGFSVILLDEEPVPAGYLEQLTFLAKNNGAPLLETSIDCYVYDDHTLLSSVVGNTDENGTFTMDIVIPSSTRAGEWSDTFSVLFKTEVDNNYTQSSLSIRYSYWDNEYEYLDQLSLDTQIDVFETSSNRTFDIVLKSPDLDGQNEMVRLYWKVGGIDGISNWTDPGWYLKTQLTNNYRTAEMTWSGELYSGKIDIPDYIPDDVPISIYGFVKLIDRPDEEARYSLVNDVKSYVDTDPPSIQIRSPREGDKVDRSFSVNGIASDDEVVSMVMIRIDEGPWELAVGTERWHFDVRKGRLSEGFHVIEAISFDGSRYSDADEIEIEYILFEHQTFEAWPIVILLVILIGAICSIYLIGKEISRKQET